MSIDYDRLRQGDGANASFDNLYRDIRLAERVQRRQLEEELSTMRKLLLYAILTLSSEAVDRLVVKDPDAINRLDLAGWRRLLSDASRDYYNTLYTKPSAPARSEELEREVAALRAQLAALEAGSPIEEVTLKVAGDEILETRDLDASVPGRVTIPPLPSSPPTQYTDLISSQTWLRQSQFLALMAITGWSLQRQLVEEAASMFRISPGAGTLKAMLAGMIKNELIVKHKVATAAGMVVVLALSPLGEDILGQLRIAPATSEWERLAEVRASGFPDRAAMICLFAAQARALGHAVELLPLENGAVKADIRLDHAGEGQVLVCVEHSTHLSEERLQLWRSVQESQGFVAFCAATAEAREVLVTAAFAADISGRATDFQFLRDWPTAALWAEQWPAVQS